jgi:hypothetical protein
MRKFCSHAPPTTWLKGNHCYIRYRAVEREVRAPRRRHDVEAESVTYVQAMSISLIQGVTEYSQARPMT